MQRCFSNVLAAWLLLGGLLACCIPGSARAEGGHLDEQRVKAAFVYNFARFTVWPAHDSSAFRLCIIGDVFSTEAFDALNGKSVHDKPVEIIHIDAPTVSDGCDLLYISGSHAARLDELVSQFGGQPVLTVSSIDGFIDHGGIIGFRIIDNKVRFEINVSAATRAGLSISSRLLSLASRVSMDR